MLLAGCRARCASRPTSSGPTATVRHLARVLESEAVESLALSGGPLSAAASIELLVANIELDGIFDKTGERMPLRPSIPESN